MTRVSRTAFDDVDGDGVELVDGSCPVPAKLAPEPCSGARFLAQIERPVCRADWQRDSGEADVGTDKDAVEAALRGLPSHGWTQGMFGRRDRCLLVLSQLAGVPYRHLAALTAGDIQIAEGAATIQSAVGEWTLRPADDVEVCGPCAVVRWLKILDLAVTQLSIRTIAGANDSVVAICGRC